MRLSRATLTPARPPVACFPATFSDDISGERAMTVPVAIQDQSSVFFFSCIFVQDNHAKDGGKKL